MSYTIIKDPAIEPFHISKDQYCYTVVQTVTPDPSNLEKGSEGKNYEKPIGHYSNLSHALKNTILLWIILMNGNVNKMK